MTLPQSALGKTRNKKNLLQNSIPRVLVLIHNPYVALLNFLCPLW